MKIWEYAFFEFPNLRRHSTYTTKQCECVGWYSLIFSENEIFNAVKTGQLESLKTLLEGSKTALKFWLQKYLIPTQASVRVRTHYQVKRCQGIDFTHFQIFLKIQNNCDCSLSVTIGPIQWLVRDWTRWWDDSLQFMINSQIFLFC